MLGENESPVSTIMLNEDVTMLQTRALTLLCFALITLSYALLCVNYEANGNLIPRAKNHLK